MKELSDADKCRKNGWKVSDILKAKSCYGRNSDLFYIITAIGESKVLGKRTFLPEKTTSGEEILTFDDREYTWRLVKNNGLLIKKNIKKLRN